MNSIRFGLRQARFALDARGVPFLSQRINVHEVDREALDRLVLGFVQCVALYRDADQSQIGVPGGPVRSGDLPKDGEGTPHIRV